MCSACITLLCSLQAKLGDVYVNDAFGTAHRARISSLTGKVGCLWQFVESILKPKANKSKHFVSFCMTLNGWTLGLLIWGPQQYAGRGLPHPSGWLFDGSRAQRIAPAAMAADVCRCWAMAMAAMAAMACCNLYVVAMAPSCVRQGIGFLWQGRRNIIGPCACSAVKKCLWYVQTEFKHTKLIFYNFL